MNWSCEHKRSRINWLIATDCRTLRPHDKGVHDQASYIQYCYWLIDSATLMLIKINLPVVTTSISFSTISHTVLDVQPMMWLCWLALHALLVACSVQHWLTYTNLWSPIIYVYTTYQWQHIVVWHLVLSMELRMLLNVNHQSESVHCRTFVSVWSVYAYTDTTGKLWGAATLIPAAHSSVQLCFQDSSQHSHLRHSVYALPWLP